MDDDASSRSSSMSKAPSAAEEASAEGEESGWTAYFDDFFASQKGEGEAVSENCSVATTGGSGAARGGSSMVSDAASCAEWKVRAAVTGALESRKKLSFRKRKSGPVVDDDTLEDTASSPVNSPKVLQGGVGSENFREEIKGDAIHELGFTNETVNECIDLKKKGLCLVPMSMLVDYLA